MCIAQCVECRKRKVRCVMKRRASFATSLTAVQLRCNRKEPCCSRCIERSITCLYPQRAKRSTLRSVVQQPHSSPLQRSGHATETQQATFFYGLRRPMEIFSSQFDQCSTQCQYVAGKRFAQTDCGVVYPARPRKEARRLPNTSPGFSDWPIHGVHHACHANLSTSLRADAARVLGQAVDHVQALRIQAITRLSHEEPLCLPRNLTKAWMKSMSVSALHLRSR